MAEKKKKLSELEAPSVTDWLAQFGTGAVGPGDVQPATHILAGLVGSTVQNLATLPERAFRAAGGVRQGEYDPGPILEAAMLPMGATSFSAPRGALGTGLTSPAPKKMDPGMAAALEKAGIKPGVPMSSGDPVQAALSNIAEALKANPPAASQKMPLWFEVLKGRVTSEPSKPTLAKKIEPLKRRVAQADPKLDKFFEPLGWQDLRSVHATETSRGIPARASGLGFNPEFPLFKGRASERPAVERSLPDPSRKDFERGLFFANVPRVAQSYGPVTEYVARSKNPAKIDWRDATGNTFYESDDMHRLVEAARARGHDILEVKNIRDIGAEKPQSQFIVLDPAVVRRPHAAFDPARMNENDLLAGLAGVGMLGGLAGLSSDRRQ